MPMVYEVANITPSKPAPAIDSVIAFADPDPSKKITIYGLHIHSAFDNEFELLHGTDADDTAVSLFGRAWPLQPTIPVDDQFYPRADPATEAAYYQLPAGKSLFVRIDKPEKCIGTVWYRYE